MKRAFTLIEMMIVVAVLVVLMTVTFKLMGTGTESERRTRTVARMQRLENCLSGYYAAFGSYPPVKLHGNRDIYVRNVGNVQDPNGQRNEDIWSWNKLGEQAERRAWAQVEVACRVQPVACRFPFPDSPDWNKLIKGISDDMKEYCQEEFESMDEDVGKLVMGGFDSVCENKGRLKNSGELDWNKIQLFQFGLMSYLLPRYLVMMNGPESFYTDYAQWTGNNGDEAPRDPFRGGVSSKQQWTDVWRQAQNARRGQPRDIAQLANISSQSVCARWMPNLEGICACNAPQGTTKLFGVDIKSYRGEDSTDLSYKNVGGNDDGMLTSCNITMYRPEGSALGVQQYVLDCITVRDGWAHEFYYFSPAPYQRYTLWSAGANGRTFPPWISRKDLSSQANRCVSLWIDDDIIHLAH